MALRDYQRAKTGSLFAAATVAGAEAAGADADALARARRVPRRGLPGGRRHPRRGRRPAGASASRSAGTWRSAGPASAASSAWTARSPASTAWWQGCIAAIPDCRGAAAAARPDARSRPSAWCRGDDRGACRAASASPRPQRPRRRTPASAVAAWPAPQTTRRRWSAPVARRGATGCSAAPASSAGRPRFPLTRPIARRRARGAVRSGGRLRLFAGAAGLRAAAPVRHPRRRPAVAAGAGRAARPGRAAGAAAAARPRLALRLVERRGAAATASARSARAMVGNPAPGGDDRAPRLALRATWPTRWRCCAANAAADRAGAATGPMPTTRRAGELGAASGWPTTRALMAASQPLVADEVLDAYPIASAPLPARRRRRRGRVPAPPPRARAPSLRLMLFDLPAVAERARGALRRGAARRPRRRRSAATSSPTRCRTGADVVSLVRVLHDHDDDSVLRILRAVRAALPRRRHAAAGRADGRARRAPSRWATPISASTCWRWAAAGRARRASCPRCSQAAGFATIRRVPTRMPLQTGVLVAHVPAA